MMIKDAWFIAPSNKITLVQLTNAKSRFTRLGLKYYFLESITRTDLYFAGTLSRRAKELTTALSSPNGNLVVAVKGGYASMELLSKLNWKKILKSKKTVMGYSDITAILLGLHTRGYKGRLIHGPNAGTKAWGNVTRSLIKNCINDLPYSIKVPRKAKFFNKNNFSGRVIGGNLRIISHMFGTKFELNPLPGDVLFFEDVQEESPAIYTMFLQLHMSGKLDNISGLLIGEMNKSTHYLPLLKRFLKHLKIPIIYELPLGHGKNMIPIRLGDEVKFDSETNELSFKILK